MCIAIWKPENKTISKETLAECFRSNRDGAGFMYAENKKLHTQKGFFTFDEFYEAYQEHENKPCLIHFRIKTHGPVSAENCHPFSVNKSLGFIHNGIINGFGSADYSDTRSFNEKILQPLVSKWGNLALFQPAIKTLIEARIGYSKLVFLDRHGNHHIFNEDKGVWDDDVWYSNTSYKPYVPTYVKPKEVIPTPPKVYSPKLVEAGKKAFRVLQTGDLVNLTRGHWSERNQEYYSTDVLFEVISINSNYTATLAHENEIGVEVYVHDVPFSKIDFATIPEDAEEAAAYEEFSEYGYSRMLS